MHFRREAGVPPRLHIVGAAADELERLIHRPVEQDVVVAHVEMAIVVDPGSLDVHHRRYEGSEEDRLKIKAVEHRDSRAATTIPCNFGAFMGGADGNPDSSA